MTASPTIWRSYGSKRTVQFLAHAPSHPRGYAPASATEPLVESRNFVATGKMAFAAHDGVGSRPRCAPQREQSADTVCCDRSALSRRADKLGANAALVRTAYGQARTAGGHEDIKQNT